MLYCISIFIYIKKYYADKTRNKKIVNNANNTLIELRSAVNRSKIFNNGNPEKVIDIVEEIVNFNKQEKGKGLPLKCDREKLKILTPKQMFQRLPIALAQVQAGNTSENVLNKIRQKIHSLYQSNEITVKVCNNIMNSIKV